jgi:hypothetical protein
VPSKYTVVESEAGNQEYQAIEGELAIRSPVHISQSASVKQSPLDREKGTVCSFGVVCSTVCSMFYCYLYKKLLRL